MDPITIANLALTGIQTLAQIYNGIQKANADALKPLADQLSAINAMDDAGIAAANAEIAKLTPPTE